MKDETTERLRAMFPRASQSFIDANTGLRAEKSKQDSGEALVNQAQRKEKVHEIPSVSIVMYRVRLLDADNAYASTKPLLDCLCESGLITDDSPSDINLQVTQEKVDHYHEQRTEVHIKYP